MDDYRYDQKNKFTSNLRNGINGEFVGSNDGKFCVETNRDESPHRYVRYVRIRTVSKYWYTKPTGTGSLKPLLLHEKEESRAFCTDV